MPGVVQRGDNRIDFLGGAGESQYGVAACVTALGGAEFAENENAAKYRRILRATVSNSAIGTDVR